MKKINFVWLVVAIAAISFFVVPNTAKAALADGTYSINYTVLQGDSGSASMANDYFDKPATLTVSGGQAFLELQVNHSSWITALSVGSQPEQVLSADTAADTRRLSFNIADPANPVPAKIKVDIENSDLSYHHEYNIVLNLDIQGASLIAAATKTADSKQETPTSANTPAENEAAAASGKVANPKSGDTTPIFIYSLLFVGALGGLFIYRKQLHAK